MSWIAILVALLFTLVGAACILLIIAGLPGSIIMYAMALVIELCDVWWLPEGETVTFGLWVLVGGAIVIAIGEGLELLAGVWGAKRGGATKRGMIGALIGGVVGAIFLTFGVPIIGTIIGAIVGTFLGALIAEMTADDAELRRTFKPAAGATVGRVLGALGKMGAGVVAWSVLSVAAFWPGV